MWSRVVLVAFLNSVVLSYVPNIALGQEGQDQSLFYPPPKACGDSVDTLGGQDSKYNGNSSKISCHANPGADGYEYQCVEFVRRYYRIVKGCAVGLSCDTGKWNKNLPAGIANGNGVSYYTYSTQFGLEKHQNGQDLSMPQVEDILSYSGGKYGHVAIVKTVVATSNSNSWRIYVMEQNVNPKFTVKPIALTRDPQSGFYTISDTRLGKKYAVQGWLRLPSGSVAINATLDTNTQFSGTLNYGVTDPSGHPLSNTLAVPLMVPKLHPGAYTITYTSGGPANSTLSGISPCTITSPPSFVCKQTLTAGQTLAFNLQFKSNLPTAGFLMASGNMSAIEGQTLNLTVPTGGTASVSFSASRSVTSSGSIVGWNWNLDGIKASNQFSFTTNLPKGSHPVTLVVTTDSGAQSSPATGTIVVTESTPQALWSVSGHDSQRTGLANYVGPGEVPRGRAPRWSYSTSAAIVGDIVVSAEGTLYVASDKLYALTPSGTSYAPPVMFDHGVPLGSPAIDDTNGFVYVVVSSPNPTNDPSLRAYDVIQLSKQLTNQTTVYHSPYPYSNPNIVPHGLVIATDGTVYFTDGATVVARGGHSWTTGTPNTGPCFGNPGFLMPTLGSDGNVFVPCQAYAGNAFGAGLYKFDAATGAQLKYTPYPYMRVEFMFDAQNRLRAGDSSSFGVNSTGHYDAWDTNLALVSDVQSDDTSSRSSLLPDGSSTMRIGKSTLVDPTNTFYYDPNYQGAQTNTLSARGAHSWDIRGGTGGSTSFFSTVPSVDSAGNIFVGTVAGIESRSGIDGSLIWSFATGDAVTTQPVIAGPSVLYVGTSTGKIYAF